MSINKPKLDRFKVLDLILWAVDEYGYSDPDELQTKEKQDELQAILPAKLHIVRPYNCCYENNEDGVKGYYECSDGTFRSEFCIKESGSDKMNKIEGHSLIQVNNARKVKRKRKKNIKGEYKEDFLEIDCEVLIDGRYIEEFMSSDMVGTIENRPPALSLCVKLNDDPDKLSSMKIIKHEAELRHNLWIQARNQEHTDVKFVFPDGEILHAHKAVLSSQSEVFRTHFIQDPPFEDQHVVNIKDTTKDVFHDFLHYIYRGFTYFYDVKHQLSLLYLATKYLMKDLENKTTYFLQYNFLNWDVWKPYRMPALRYFDIFLFHKITPDTYPALKLAEDHVRENAFYMIHDPDFFDVSFDDIKDFLSLDPPVEMTPNHLLETVLTWGVHQRRTLKDIDNEEKIEQLKDMKENVRILIDLINLKESTLDAFRELDLNNLQVEEVIDRAALEEKIQQNMNEKYDDKKDPCLDEAYNCRTTTELSHEEFTTCATVDISSILSKGADQVVYSKKFNLDSVTGKVTIIFEREMKENEAKRNKGFVTIILTSVPSKGQEAQKIILSMDFVIFNLVGKPFFSDNTWNQTPFHQWIYLKTNKRIIESFMVYRWESLIDPNKKSLTGRSLVNFKLTLSKNMLPSLESDTE